MTTTEMLYEFQTLINNSLPMYKDVSRPSSDDLMIHLNIAYTRFILKRYLSNDSNTNALTIQDMQDELVDLIQVAYLPVYSISNGELSGFGYYINLPADYYYYIRAAVAVTRNDEIDVGTNPNVNINLTNSFITFERSKTTRFNEPILREPISILKEGRMIFIVDRWTQPTGTNPVTLTYLKKIKYLGFVDTDSTTTVPEISDTVHEEIVKFAYDMWVNNITYTNRVKANDN